MDNLSKKILEYMNKKDNSSSTRYSFSDDLEKMATELSVDTEVLRSAIRYLRENQYITYIYSGSNPYWFMLDHKGFHWEEFRREEIIDYLKDNWIEFFAMLAACASLVLSIIALSA